MYSRKYFVHYFWKYFVHFKKTFDVIQETFGALSKKHFVSLRKHLVHFLKKDFLHFLERHFVHYRKDFLYFRKHCAFQETYFSPFGHRTKQEINFTCPNKPKMFTKHLLLVYTLSLIIHISLVLALIKLN